MARQLLLRQVRHHKGPRRQSGKANPHVGNPAWATDTSLSFGRYVQAWLRRAYHSAQPPPSFRTLQWMLRQASATSTSHRSGMHLQAKSCD
eukprot:4756194-Amphidinium_carterae.1